MLGLAAFNALFLAAAVLVRPDPAVVGRALLTWAPLPAGDPVTLLLLLTSTIGATVTPWMIFFQQSASVDKGLTAVNLRHGRVDTALGAVLATVFGAAALLTGAVLAGQVGGSVQGLAGAGFPAALAQTAGAPVGTLFALGLIEAGAVAILTISASTAYAAAECLGLPRTFNTRPTRGLLFHGVNVSTALAAAVVVLIPGVPLLAISLNANILATVLLPSTLVFMVMLANDRQLMGPAVNRRPTNILAVTVIVHVTVCSVGYAVASFLQTIGVLPGKG